MAKVTFLQAILIYIEQISVISYLVVAKLIKYYQLSCETALETGQQAKTSLKTRRQFWLDISVPRLVKIKMRSTNKALFFLMRLIILYCFQVFCHELQFPEFTSAVADMKNFVADGNNIKPSYAGLFIFPYLRIVDAYGLWTSWLLPTLERELQATGLPCWIPFLAAPVRLRCWRQPARSPTRMGWWVIG